MRETPAAVVLEWFRPSMLCGAGMGSVLGEDEMFFLRFSRE
jgi:hypothetical protein